jgi:mxaJ protein
MCSDFLRCVSLALCLLGAPAEARTLRVCADPNNLPFSNRQQQGFENKLVDILAREMKATVAYTWWAQRRGFLRNTLKANLCDVVPGVPVGLHGLRTTAPYYRSSFVFVTRAGAEPVVSMDDPRLQSFKVGVQNGGDDGAATPAALALSRRRIPARGYSVLGDYREPNPPARIMEAVEIGDVDVAVVWGPLAGFFARRSGAPLSLRPVPAEGESPMAFAIALGVRKEDERLAAELNRILIHTRSELDGLLASYGVPIVPALTAAP